MQTSRQNINPPRHPSARKYRRSIRPHLRPSVHMQCAIYVLSQNQNPYIDSPLIYSMYLCTYSMYMVTHTPRGYLQHSPTLAAHA